MAGVKLCPLCGPKLSMFCMVMSGWGIIFLTLLGTFFYFESGILINDIESEYYSPSKPQAYIGDVKDGYRSCAINCWIAAALYLVTLVGAFWQNKWNPSVSA